MKKIFALIVMIIVCLALAPAGAFGEPQVDISGVEGGLDILILAA